MIRPLEGRTVALAEGRQLEELAQMLLQALMSMDRDELRRLAGAAVDRFAGMEPGRPVGGTYYLYRTLRQLDFEGLTAKEIGERLEISPENVRHELYRGLSKLRKAVNEFLGAIPAMFTRM